MENRENGREEIISEIIEERCSQAQIRHKVLHKNFWNKREKLILKRESRHTYIYLHQTVFYL